VAAATGATLRVVAYCAPMTQPASKPKTIPAIAKAMESSFMTDRNFES
jgi:hypothetical protein